MGLQLGFGLEAGKALGLVIGGFGFKAGRSLGLELGPPKVCFGFEMGFGLGLEMGLGLEFEMGWVDECWPTVGCLGVRA